MASLPFRIVNVFTCDGDPLSGNPLCVFESGEGLDTQTMQRLARQLNLSETTFLLPSTRASARVRIFTPSFEMPFAGHPTLGSAHVCRALGRCSDDASLEMPAGIIPVRAQGRRWTLQANPPTSRPCDAPLEALAGMLGVAAEEITEPPLWVNAGKQQLLVPLRSEAAVRSVRPGAEQFAAARGEDGDGMVCVFAQRAPGRMLARFFFESGGAIIEDPATGSAAANLGGWLMATGRSLPQSFEISQGEYVGRPSRLFLTIDLERRVFVGGDVIELGRGTFEL
jgi:PhzF family phenazine biosynthesis protein